MVSGIEFWPSFLSYPLPVTLFVPAWVGVVIGAAISWVLFWRALEFRARLINHAHEWPSGWANLWRWIVLCCGTVGTIVAVLPVFCTVWISDTEFGLSRSRAYQTGVYLAPIEPIQQLPRFGEFFLVKADGVGSVKIRWLVTDPEKLSAIYGDLTALGGIQSSESLVNNDFLLDGWIENKLLPLTPEARQLINFKEVSVADLPGEKFLASVRSVLEPYGIEAAIFVRMEYVLKEQDRA